MFANTVRSNFRLADNVLATRTIIRGMFGSAIRTISTARSGPIAAAAYFSRKVEVWNFETAELVCHLDTVFGFGGHRLTLSPSGERCVAASFRAGQNGGVVCYETGSGRAIWRRGDLRGVQGVHFSATGDTIWCRFEDRPVQRLDARTGLTVESLRTIQKVFDSPFTTDLLYVRRRDFVLTGSTKMCIPRLTFAMLDATFSPDALCLSEASGPVRCLDTKTTEEKWRYVPPSGSHVLGFPIRLMNLSTVSSGHTSAAGRSSCFSSLNPPGLSEVSVL